MGIDRNSPLPLYYQLKRLLLAKIESRELKPGDILPTEQQIQEQYDVSRTTVRQALSELEDEGKITRHRGRGTFVAKPKVQHTPELYPNLEDHMVAQGLTPGWQLLSAEWAEPDETVAQRLQCDPGQRVFRLERLRLENDEAIGYHVAHVAPPFAASIDQDAYTVGGSLRYLRGLTVLDNSLADRTLDAVAATPRIASLLRISPGEALLRVSRLIYTQDQRPIETFVGVYRGDRFQYNINHMRAISTINA